MGESHRVAIVTGASRGLGEVIAHVLAEQHYDLVIGARDAAALCHVSPNRFPSSDPAWSLGTAMRPTPRHERGS
jgi:NAD(P)-dependent dehydrogenase (short-subunit alcohol dehydrogenase family)